MASFLPLYSVSGPPTTSVSASGMSNGTRSSLAWRARIATTKAISSIGITHQWPATVHGKIAIFEICQLPARTAGVRAAMKNGTS